ncbi:cytochrome P450 [Lactifluus subvellereus]|nr:cytochrome P450 [Lactifluus subvellereus]
MRHMAGQVILSIAYGIDVAPHGDRNVETAEKAVGAIIAGSLRGRIFDLFPFRMLSPSWFPGAGFKKEAQLEWVPHVRTALHAPYEAVKRQMARKPSSHQAFCGPVATSMISELNEKSTEEEIYTSMAIPATMYLGAQDTTVSVLHSFFLATVLYPGVQRKAQTEIDAVVGKERLPNFGDRPLLPYVSPLRAYVDNCVSAAIPHRLTTDDVYKGWFLPAGIIVIGNSWGILHDEANVWPHPERFIPERYLPGGGATIPTADTTFEYGRRICPPRFMGRSTDWIARTSCQPLTFPRLWARTGGRSSQRRFTNPDLRLIRRTSRVPSSHGRRKRRGSCWRRHMMHMIEFGGFRSGLFWTRQWHLLRNNSGAGQPIISISWCNP